MARRSREITASGQAKRKPNGSRYWNLHLLAIAIVCLCLAVVASAESWQVESLKGITDVSVQVADLTADDRQYGLSRDQLETDLELKLRLAGIRVVSGDTATAGSFHLRAHLWPITTENTGRLIAVMTWWRLEFRQSVHLARRPEVVIPQVATWSDSQVWYSSSRLFTPDKIRKAIRDATDKFINLYLEANPREAPE